VIAVQGIQDIESDTWPGHGEHQITYIPPPTPKKDLDAGLQEINLEAPLRQASARVQPANDFQNQYDDNPPCGWPSPRPKRPLKDLV